MISGMINALTPCRKVRRNADASCCIMIHHGNTYTLPSHVLVEIHQCLIKIIEQVFNIGIANFASSTTRGKWEILSEGLFRTNADDKVAIYRCKMGKGREWCESGSAAIRQEETARDPSTSGRRLNMTFDAIDTYLGARCLVSLDTHPATVVSRVP